MANLEGNRWHIKDNEIIATYAGWVAIIKSVFVGNGLLLRWALTLSEGTGGESLPITYYKTLEEALEKVQSLEQYKTFSELKNHHMMS